MQEGCSAVATCGTGTRKLIDALKAREIVPPVIVCMDRDSAGDEAAGKLCTQRKAQGVTHLRTTTPEGYKDPNELLMGDSELFDLGCEIVLHRQKNCRLYAHNVNQEKRTRKRACATTESTRVSQHGHRKLQAYSDYYSGVVRYVPEESSGIASWKRWAGYRRAQARELCKKPKHSWSMHSTSLTSSSARLYRTM
jgi:hypothetical protein